MTRAAGIAAGLLLIGLSVGCAWLNQVRPKYREIPSCLKQSVAYRHSCDGKILEEGYSKCNQCYRASGKAFPAAEDMVGGCYDDEHSSYCVSLETACSDPRCRPDTRPTFRAAPLDASADAGQ